MAIYRTYKESTYWYPDDWWYVIQKKNFFGWFDYLTFGSKSSFNDAVKQLQQSGNIVISKY